MSESEALRLLRELHAAEATTRDAARTRIDADPVLRAQVERLLAVTVGPPATTADASATRRIGPYQLLHELGSGGMGTVFLAERILDGASQRVALKLLHGMPTEEGRRRFARERGLLAGLNHPHIAALLDGGETAGGQPWLAMEYVEGEALGAWVRRTRPPLRRRLGTLIQLCDAVSHAHQRLILHRDIKPGNVLVREDGTPVLLDFGIGRMLDDTSSARTATLVFTPAYAAPEQLTGRGLTTATDVHGLGLLLYELLSECNLAERPAESTRPPPSALATDAAHARQIRGDLDRIVARATHAEPARRYPTAAALAEDLQRYLDGLPVSASNDSAWYRIGKFLRRHRAASAVAAIALLLSAGFVWRLAVERARALDAEARARQEARGAALARDFLVSVFQEASPEATLGRPVSPRQLLDRARDRVSSQLRGEPLAAATTWLALADTYSALGDPAQAARAAEQALAFSAGEDREQLRLQAGALERLGTAYSSLARYPESMQAYERMLALREREFSNDTEQLLDSYAALGYAAQHQGDHARALRWLERALALLDQNPPGGQEGANQTAYLLSALAISTAVQGDEDAAQRLLERLRAVAQGLDGAHPGRLYLLRTEARLAEVAGQFERSLELLEQATSLAMRVVGADAAVVAGMENDLGVALNGLGRYREALVHLERSRGMYAGRLQGSDVAVAFLDANISAVHESLGEYPSAIDYARRALAVYTRPGMPATDMRRQARVNLARALSFSGEHAEALSHMRIALDEGARGDGEGSLLHLLDRFRHAGMLRRAGQWVQAAAELDAVWPAIGAAVGEQHPMRLHLLRLRALIARDGGDRAGALRRFEELLAFAQGRTDVDPVALAEARVELAEIVHAQAPERARGLLSEALPVLQQALAEEAPARRAALRLAREWGVVLADDAKAQKR